MKDTCNLCTDKNTNYKYNYKYRKKLIIKLQYFTDNLFFLFQENCSRKRLNFIEFRCFGIEKKYVTCKKILRKDYIFNLTEEAAYHSMIPEN